MQWFRFYSDALDDPKVQRLPGELFKTWVNLLCLANKSEQRGVLPPPEDCAFALRMDFDTYCAHMAELLKRHLIDAFDDHLAPHNWGGRQKPSDDVTARVQQHRNKNTKDETLPKRSSNALEESKTRGEVDPEEKKRKPEESVQRPPAPQPLADAPTPAPKTRAKGATPAPDHFPITDDMRAWADVNAPDVDVDQQTARFLDRNRANGTTYKDWHAAWRNWLTSPYAKPTPLRPTSRAPDVASVNGVAMSPRMARNLRVLQETEL